MATRTPPGIPSTPAAELQSTSPIVLLQALGTVLAGTFLTTASTTVTVALAITIIACLAVVTGRERTRQRLR